MKLACLLLLVMFVLVVAMHRAAADLIPLKPVHALTWFFPANPISGVQVVRALVPEGLTGCTITNSRITADTVGGTNTTFNIKRCTTSAGNCTASSNIYTSDVTLSSSTQSTTGGTPNTTTISAGDAFIVNFTAVATALLNVTISMAYTCTGG